MVRQSTTSPHEAKVRLVEVVGELASRCMKMRWRRGRALGPFTLLLLLLTSMMAAAASVHVLPSGGRVLEVWPCHHNILSETAMYSSGSAGANERNG